MREYERVRAELRIQDSHVKRSRTIALLVLSAAALGAHAVDVADGLDSMR
jgi:hypothetical protein